MYRASVCIVLALFPSASALGAPYWIAWEGNDLPENQGWTRVWGDWTGQYHGSGAVRTLEDGVLTYDSLYDNGVYDYSIMHRPAEIDPGPGELFVMEWCLRVDQVVGRADPSVVVSSDEAWLFGLEFGYDRMYSVFEDYLTIGFSPGVFHEYRLVSPDMRLYDLYVDDQCVRRGAFRHSVGPSEVGWGDSIQGAASRHEWDFFRFGAVPEPESVLLMTLCACCGGRRARR